jgi:beta-lactamase class A
MTARRAFTIAAAFTLASGRPWARAASAAAPPTGLHAEVARRLGEIERASGGDLGVQIVDTSTGATFGHRAGERFLMCSTFKLLASALVLHRVDRGRESLARRIVYRAADLVPYSPVTEKHVGGAGLSLGELCEATLTTSDNTAANLILASYGGPRALTAFVRALGDTVTRFDRTEPTLNRWQGALDTTSPRAMAQSLQRVALGDALRPASRDTLQRWLRANLTGKARLEAGLPAGWSIGDKTGSTDDDGVGATTNDIAVVWPPGRAPLLVTAYLTRSRASAAARNATLAQVGQLLPLVAGGAAPR